MAKTTRTSMSVNALFLMFGLFVLSTLNGFVLVFGSGAVSRLYLGHFSTSNPGDANAS